MSWYAQPESHFVSDRADSWKGSSVTSVVWRYHVVVDWTPYGGLREAMTIDVWNPRIECTDADEVSGQPIYDYEYDHLSNADTGEELTDDQHDGFSDAVLELLRETG